MLRDAYFNVNDIQKAYKYASMLSDDSEINKKIINAYLKYVAYNLYKKGKYDKALEILNSLDGDIEVMELKGKIYAALKDYSKAEKAFKEAYIYNNSPAVAKDLIELYFKQNKIQKAKNFTDFSNKELKDTYYLNLAKYYLSKKDIIQMNKALDNVSQKTPEYEYLRGVLCFYQQNYDCALKKLLKLKPSIERNYYLILTYLKLNKKTKAKELFDKTFKTYPKEYAKKVANIYIQLGEIEKAKKILGY
jgi:predicted Zn-dependent protease